MNKSLFCFVLAIIALLYQPLKANAQADFAPIGAKWYYSYTLHNPPSPTGQPVAGYILQESVGDTLIHNITARKLQRTFFGRSAQDNSIVSAEVPGVYVYATADTVFHFDEPLDRFLPLYIFNVAAGDTLVHRVPSAYADYTTDTTWRFLVDSVVTATYNNHPVKVVYNWGFPASVQEPSMSLRGPYYQYFGLTEGHLAEYNFNHPVGATYETYSLRCYQDANFDVHFGDPAITCDSLAMLPVSVTGIDFLSRKLSVYPNPASGEVHIALDGLSLQSVAMIDLLGRNVWQQDYLPGTTQTKLDVAGMNKGTYILRVTHKEQGTVYRKILLR